jgi:hypothetical protein
MFNIQRVPVWKRRIFVGVISAIFLAVSYWLKHTTEDFVIALFLALIGNLLPFRTTKEVQKDKTSRVPRS